MFKNIIDFFIEMFKTPVNKISTKPIEPYLPTAPKINIPSQEIVINPEKPSNLIYYEDLPQSYFKLILNYEGLYVNHPNDKGGETNRGITIGTLNKAKALGIVASNVSIKSLTEDLDSVYKIYNIMFYKKSYSNKLPHPLAFAYFDACINHGIGGRTKSGSAVGAGMLMQSILIEQFGKNISLDGIVGPNTLKAINEVLKLHNPHQIATLYNNRRELYFRRIVENNPAQKVFLNGWLRRVNRVREFCLN